MKKQNIKDRVENTYRIGLEMRVVSDQKKEILKVGEDYGYEIVFKTILLDIMQSPKKKEIG